MFDRYVLGPRSMDVAVHHTERRAPTDESVRLLKEMEAAARAKVVEAMRIESNTVKAVVHRHMDNFDQRMIFKIHYAVNGHKREVTVGIEDTRATIESRLEVLWKALADDIAGYIMGEVVAKEVYRK